MVIETQASDDSNKSSAFEFGTSESESKYEVPLKSTDGLPGVDMNPVLQDELEKLISQAPDDEGFGKVEMAEWAR